jgi:hypothetical protein
MRLFTQWHKVHQINQEEEKGLFLTTYAAGVMTNIPGGQIFLRSN